MSKAHKTKRDARREARARKKLYTRIITIGVVLLAAVVVIWLVTTAINSQKAAALTATQTAASASSNSVLTPGGPTPELVGTKQYSAAPPMLIDVTKQYFANVKMAKGGEFVIQLYPDKAPITVNSFVFLARNGFFDGVTFHRVLEGFMAQGGDPTGTGGGGPGYKFDDEITSHKHGTGVLSMAKAGPNTNGSQFFITFVPTPHLDGIHSVFGQVVQGMDVVNKIKQGDRMKRVTIQES